MPLQMRLPKKGFKNPNRVDYVPINVERLQAIAEKYGLEALDIATLIDKKVIKKTDKVKVLGDGAIASKLTISAHAFSKSAVAAIEAVGGTTNVIE